MPEYLPEFASEWMKQWSRAAGELARVRNQELRELSDAAAIRAASAMESAGEFKPVSGLVIQQQWFMRQRILMAERRET